jgi:hypothetical protein
MNIETRTLCDLLPTAECYLIAAIQFPAACCIVVLGSIARVRHSRMHLAGIQANFGLDPRLEHSGVTTWGKIIRGPFYTPLFAARFFVLVSAKL